MKSHFNTEACNRFMYGSVEQKNLILIPDSKYTTMRVESYSVKFWYATVLILIYCKNKTITAIPITHKKDITLSSHCLGQTWNKLSFKPLVMLTMCRMVQDCLALRMKALRFQKMLVTIYWWTRCNIPETWIFHKTALKAPNAKWKKYATYIQNNVNNQHTELQVFVN